MWSVILWGEAVLLNSCLTSIPKYLMGMYWLHEGTQQCLDTARARFFWQGVGKKKKYHMIKWDALDKPKEFGGLGFIDTRAMNIALLSRWIFRIECGEDSACINLLWKKYLGDNSFFQKRHKNNLQF